MGGVHITIDVGLEGGVHRDETYAACHSGVVGDLRGTQDELVLEEVDVLVDALEPFVAHAERAGTAKLTTARTDEVDDGILDNLGVHLEGGYRGVGTESTEHGIGHVAHTALQGRKPGGMMPRLRSLMRNCATL